jgi:hypothetical protein
MLLYPWKKWFKWQGTSNACDPCGKPAQSCLNSLAGVRSLKKRVRSDKPALNDT